jgi:hypothetical protein
VLLLAAATVVAPGGAENPRLGDATAAANRAHYLVIGIRSSAARNLVYGFVSCENGFERKVAFAPVGAGFHRFTVDAAHPAGVYGQMTLQHCDYVARLRANQAAYDAKIAACAGTRAPEPRCDPDAASVGMVGVQGSR